MTLWRQIDQTSSKLFAIIFLTTISCCISTAYADPLNSSFETGDLTDWETIGVAFADTDGLGAVPTDGTYQAVVTNEFDSFLSFEPAASVSFDEIETFLGLAPFTLDGLGNGLVTNGSAIKQAFTAAAGDKLLFNWNFLTFEDPEEALTFGTNDFAFITLTGPANLVGELADTQFVPTVPSFTPFDLETGYLFAEIVLPVAGDYTLGFGVVNVEDDFLDSGLLIDNVRLEAAVPEPKSVTLLLLGGIALLLWPRFSRSSFGRARNEFGTKQSRTKQLFCRPRFQPLEDRRLLAGVVISHGTMSVSSLAANNLDFLPAYDADSISVATPTTSFGEGLEAAATMKTGEGEASATINASITVSEGSTHGLDRTYTVAGTLFATAETSAYTVVPGLSTRVEADAMSNFSIGFDQVTPISGVLTYSSNGGGGIAGIPGYTNLCCAGGGGSGTVEVEYVAGGGNFVVGAGVSLGIGNFDGSARSATGDFNFTYEILVRLPEPDLPNFAVTSAVFAQSAGEEFIEFELAADNFEDGRRVSVGIYQSEDKSFDQDVDTFINLGLSEPLETGLASGRISIDHAKAEDGKYFLVVANPDRTIDETTFADNVFDLQKPDIAAGLLEWDVSGGGLKFEYEITGNDLPEDAVFELYWAKDGEPIDLPDDDEILWEGTLERTRQDDPHEMMIPFGPDTPGVEVTEGVFNEEGNARRNEYRAPSDANQILLVLDPDEAGQAFLGEESNGGRISESNEENNKLLLILPKPDLSGANRRITLIQSVFDTSGREATYEISSPQFPDGATIDIEKTVLRRSASSSAEWLDVISEVAQMSVAEGAVMATITSEPRAAGAFHVRGVVDILGVDFVSNSQPWSEVVHFPNTNQFKTLIDGEGASETGRQFGQALREETEETFLRTENHTTTNNTWQEYGFAIQLITSSIGPQLAFGHARGPDVEPSPTAQPGIDLNFGRDNTMPAEALRRGGSTYWVGVFHAHTPQTMEVAGYSRFVGPSGPDEEWIARNPGVGLVYDYRGDSDGTPNDRLSYPHNLGLENAELHYFGSRRPTPGASRR